MDNGGYFNPRGLQDCLTILALLLFTFLSFLLIKRHRPYLLNLWKKFKRMVFQGLIFIRKFVDRIVATSRKFLNKNLGDPANAQHWTLFYTFVIVICFFGFLIYKILPQIMKYNFSYSWRIELLVIVGLGILLCYTIFCQLVFSRRFNWKTVLSIFICILSFYFIDMLKDRTLWAYAFSVLLFSPYLFAYFLKRSWKRPNLWIIFTILIMISLFLFGVTVIDLIYGYRPLSLKLYFQNDEGAGLYAMNGTITCDPLNTNKILVNSTVRCYVDPPLLKINYARVTFTSYWGDENTSFLSNMSFVAPPDIFKVYFFIDGLDQQNKSINLDSTWEYTFYNLEKTKERNENFVKYFLALIGLILFSIPSMMINFKELANRKK